MPIAPAPNPVSSLLDPAPGATTPAALAAFLRGVERRAAVLAELQAGDAAVGDAAVAVTVQQFRVLAAAISLSEWPRRFWALLLAQPALRTRTAVALVLDATDRLGELGSGPRAAVLLRLAAGLDEATAAAVLGVEPSGYRLALQRALPPAGLGDPRAWQRLHARIEQRCRTLPRERLQRLHAAPTPVTPAAAAARGRRRGLLLVLWLALGLCAALLAATFWPGLP